MELSKRLNWIIEKLDKVEIIMDVGTDHGYIPIYLVKNNIAKKVIASDINKEPLKKAKINASLDGVLDKIDLRLGGGLSPLKNREAEAVIIAGMGGNLIRDILENDKEILTPLAAEKGIVRDIAFRGNNLQIDVQIGNAIINGYRSLEQEPVEIGDEVLVLIHRVYTFNDKHAEVVENKIKTQEISVFI